MVSSHDRRVHANFPRATFGTVKLTQIPLTGTFINDRRPRRIAKFPDRDHGEAISHELLAQMKALPALLIDLIPLFWRSRWNGGDTVRKQFTNGPI